MRKRIVGCIVLLLGIVMESVAQESYTERANNYISQYSELAVKEQLKSGIPASIILGQGILETEAGASELATQANNHFGIKCKRDWTGQTFTHTDDKPDECFRKYNSAEESYRDHSVYLTTTPRYASLFKLPPTDYKGWAAGLKRCGYATSPTYTQRLVKIIEDFHLQDYTYVAINKKINITTPNKVEQEPVSTQANINKPVVTEDATPEPPRTEQSFTSGQQLKVNGLKAIYAFKGELLLKYAVRYNMRYEHLLEINDLPDAPLPSNMFIYLEKKNYRGIRETHVVKPGETLQQVSQLEGIQLRRLMMLNYVTRMGEEPAAGTVLYLQKMADKKPVLVSADNKANVSATVNNQLNQSAPNTNKTSEYIYKSQATTNPVASNTTQQVAQNNNQKPPVTAYVQKGDKIEKLELDKQSKLNTKVVPNAPTVVKSPTIATTPVASTKPVVKPPVPVMKEKVTVIEKKQMTDTTKKTIEPKNPTITQPVVTKTENNTTNTEANVVITNPTVPTKTNNDQTIAINTTVPSVNPIVTDTKTTGPTVTQTGTTGPAITVENEDEKDPLVRLKKKLDKVVYKEDKKTSPKVDSVTVVLPAAPPAKTTAVEPAKNDGNFYVVKKGETAYSIARKNNITLRQLMELNNMDFDDVKAGQKLRVKK